MRVSECRQYTPYHVKVVANGETTILYAVTDAIIRCVCTEKEEILESPLQIEYNTEGSFEVIEKECKFIIKTTEVTIEIDKESGRFLWKDNKGKTLLVEKGRELRKTPLIQHTLQGEEPIIKRVVTVDGERNFIENLKAVKVGEIYKAKLSFDFATDEQIHGLGQGEEGIYNYRGHNQYLYQHNMRSPIPFFISSKGYGVLFDAACLMTFNDDVRGSYVYLDAVKQLDYYVIAGDNVDALIKGYRLLTGEVPMLPKFAFGYVQSKEAYHTQEEILSVAHEYRERKIPLDLIVQDWNTWEPGQWGNKILDKKRYPNVKEMNDALHHMHIHSMISIWPNMNRDTKDYDEMKEKGYLLDDLATYDAFNEDARELYWEQIDEEMFSGGFDSWWCDSTEPFSGPDWNGAYVREPWERFLLVGDEHKKFLGQEKANLYAVLHAKGIYENQRKKTKEKRVLNLTRSGYASSQQYGTVLWSGDIAARWDVLKGQIAEGLNMSMSGIAYWTLDIGGFFVVNENWKHRGCACNNDPEPKWFWKGDYETGIQDLGYRELYTRWFEYGAFLPMFRSHGTDTPREVWNFGESGDMFYDALVATIHLRYRLMPYIYSLAGSVTMNSDTMMRSLLFDFSHDKEAVDIADEFMLGRSLLICPVTEPMYYEKGSKAIEKDKIRECYLPDGASWYLLHTGACYEGGRNIVVDAPIDYIPVFARSGSIIPMEQDLSYANESADTPFEIHIYPGDDGAFTYYEDDGDGYAYENGCFNQIEMTWKDKKKEFTIGESKIKLQKGLSGRLCNLRIGAWQTSFLYQGKKMTIKKSK